MSNKELSENKLNDISGGIDNLDKALMVGSVASAAIGTYNFIKNWRKSEKQGWDKYKDSIGKNTFIPGMITTVLSLALQHRHLYE